MFNNKKNIELSTQEILIRIRFLEINGSLSLVKTTPYHNYISLERIRCCFLIFQSLDQLQIKYL